LALTLASTDDGIIHGKNAISTDLSIRLEEALGTSAETWLAVTA
jgi:plasmid maintenance system antidote protein VapI